MLPEVRLSRRSWKLVDPGPKCSHVLKILQSWEPDWLQKCSRRNRKRFRNCKGWDMIENCIECDRLLQESNEALTSHATLGRIYDSILCTDREAAMRMKMEPEFQEALSLRWTTRRALVDHRATHKTELWNKISSFRPYAFPFRIPGEN
jgi:hypothetical protein